MTVDIRQRILNGVQAYLESDSRDPVTVRDLHGPGWNDLSWNMRSNAGAWFLFTVRKGAVSGLRLAGSNEQKHRLYMRE